MRKINKQNRQAALFALAQLAQNEKVFCKFDFHGFHTYCSSTVTGISMGQSFCSRQSI